MKIRRSQSVKKQLTRRVMQSFKSSTLDSEYSIVGAEARIHRQRLSGDYQYGAIEERVGKLKIDDAFVPEERMPNYGKKAYWPFEGRKLTIFFEPVKPFLPRSIVEFSYPTRKFLRSLSQLFPEFKIYSAEYALDVFCCDLIEVESLLYVLRKYLYFPYQRSTSQYGGLYDPVEEGVQFQGVLRREAEQDLEYRKCEEAAVYRVGNFKVYPRGDEGERVRESWSREKVDRVRMELTTTPNLLRRHEIKNLEDFIRDPKFREMCRYFTNFKRFKERAKWLPKEWQVYRAKDKDGNNDSFQQEYIQAGKRGIRNLSRKIEDAPGFEEFKFLLNSAARGFDENWSSRPMRRLMSKR